jgi:hypothetical protein
MSSVERSGEIVDDVVVVVETVGRVKNVEVERLADVDATDARVALAEHRHRWQGIRGFVLKTSQL